MSEQGDELRLIADSFDILIERNEKLQLENFALAKRVAELEVAQPKPEAKLIWGDNFHKPPLHAPGAYMIDAPLGAISISPNVDDLYLRVRCSSTQELDRNRTRRRSELGLWEPGTDKRIFRRTPHGQEEWFAVSVRFPKLPDDSSKAVFLQWHAGPSDAGEVLSRNPPLSFELHAKKRIVRCVQLWSTTNIQTGNENRNTLFEEPIVEGLWYRIVVQAIWHWEAAKGLLAVWWGGRLVVNKLGSNAYRDAAAFVFTRFGLYCPSFYMPGESPIGAPLTHVADFARLRIAGGGATFADVG